MERYLISGSNGFIGSNLSRELSTKGEVIPLDCNWTTLPEADYIFHLGAYGNLHSQHDRAEIFHANMTRTFELLEATRGMDYKKFIYISSSSVNLQTQTLYSATKKAMEVLIGTYDKPITIVRPYSVTGVGEQPEHLIPTLIDAAYTAKTIPFVESPVHDFIDVNDFVKDIIDIAHNGQAKVYDVGSGRGYSNKQVLDMVVMATGRPVNVDLVKSMREYDNKDWVCPTPWAGRSLQQTIEELVANYAK